MDNPSDIMRDNNAYVKWECREKGLWNIRRDAPVGYVNPLQYSLSCNIFIQ